METAYEGEQFNRMIGQKKLKEYIDKSINDNNVCRFNIICGMRGSGRKTIANYIANKLHYPITPVGLSASEVRDVISNSYKISEPIVYLFADGDNMSITSQNALLKVVEEPPNNAYFILTLENISNTLETIKSRGNVITTERYSAYDIEYYARYDCGVTDKEQLELIKRTCNTLGDVKLYLSNQDIYDYAKKVFENVAKVSGSNSFKIGNLINLDKDDKKYDLIMFWSLFINECVLHIEENKCYNEWVIITTRYLRELRVSGVNKSHLFDMWLLDIRRSWIYADS